ncbi:MAG: ATP-binding protein [Candidatus Omnitrophica bacterium]|nr:ATP-binding protein [Candidatus Omnitrophota bacterium]MDD5351574.1 ATP-binding protein [Candidatus Omnitrophota bacterium]MDD5551009.1 ATP-binding protein [Candidatus Omnitrophota bacterium]
MPWLNDLLQQNARLAEDIFYVMEPFLFLVVIALAVFVLLKNKQIKKLQNSLRDLQRTYQDLDNQAKLIIKTDLELHKTQSELDKKMSGLYTLQKISRILSTTLDENEIFTKITAEHISELGFDKAMAFITSPRQSSSPNIIPNIKSKIGYNDKDIEEIFNNKLTKEIFDPVINHSHVISSLDAKIHPKELSSIVKILKIHSFVCAPISTKEGIIGALFVGSESMFSPITLGDKEIISILATQIGQSIENAKLFEETWRSHQELEIKVKERTKELSRALEEINIVTKRKSDFVSAVSHELRTPLTSIKGYASLLSAGKLGEISAPVKERLEKINKHSDNLSNLITNLLDISRIEAGRIEMKIEDVNLREILDTLADLFAPQFKEKQIEFRRDLPDGLNTIPADRGQLQRVFINLVSNAFKFTPEKGKITVRAKRIDNSVQIDVEDTGAGIKKENLNKIFEEFYREDNEINQNVKGTGLGLSLVKYIIEAHKGKIWANSELNRGSTFSFILPLTRSQ